VTSASNIGSFDQQVAFANRGAALARGGCKFKADQLLPCPALNVDPETALTHEERLLHAHRPTHARFERIGEVVGVLRDDDVSFFETQHTLGFDTEGAHRGAGAHQRVPHLAGAVVRNVDLEAE
jgi:hypothetical protein